MKNKEQQESYLQNGHLINKKIQCNTCECDVTMFGSNLENRINKFGTLWSLLDGFKCRKCVSASKPKKVIVKRQREKKVKQEEKIQVPKMIFSEKRNVLLKDAPDIQVSCTLNGTCIRPDIFLNSGRVCDDCPYKNNCLSTSKTLKA
jgi:hypothetical protein